MLEVAHSFHHLLSPEARELFEEQRPPPVFEPQSKVPLSKSEQVAHDETLDEPTVLSSTLPGIK